MSPLYKHRIKLKTVLAPTLYKPLCIEHLMPALDVLWHFQKTIEHIVHHFKRFLFFLFSFNVTTGSAREQREQTEREKSHEGTDSLTPVRKEKKKQGDMRETDRMAGGRNLTHKTFPQRVETQVWSSLKTWQNAYIPQVTTNSNLKGTQPHFN